MNTFPDSSYEPGRMLPLHQATHDQTLYVGVTGNLRKLVFQHDGKNSMRLCR
jgi:hypothetical protein